jgi:hypothetical protein
MTKTAGSSDNCHRGTNDVENSHKHIASTFGAWPAGVETSCTLLRDLVALQSTQLHDEAVNSIHVDPKTLGKLSSEVKFIAKCMGVQLPFLPVHGKEEMQLFVCLILKATTWFDADEMGLKWCDFVDITIFPKLPVYLREYHGVYLKNGRVKDAAKAMKSHVELLEAINKELVPQDLA